MNKDKVFSVLSKHHLKGWKNVYFETREDARIIKKFQQASEAHELEADEQIHLLIENKTVAILNSCVITSQRISLLKTPRLISTAEMIFIKW